MAHILEEAAKMGEMFEPITVDFLMTLTESGCIREGEPIELIEGILVRKDRRDQEGDIMNVGTRHTTVLSNLEALFDPMLTNLNAFRRSQSPIQLGKLSMPEPDLTILRGGRHDYAQQHPQPIDMLICVELADSSLSFDRNTKKQLYASHNIPEYWIVDLRKLQIEQYQEPDSEGETYNQLHTWKTNEAIQFRVDNTDLQLKLSDIFQGL